MKLKLSPSPILTPFAYFYHLAILIRNYLYDVKLLKSYTSGLPIICVGNVIAGGSGKSPFVRYLALKLLAAGKKPVILSRGYGGRIKKAHQVTINDTVADVGDEAIMQFNLLKDIVPIVVSPERSAGVKLISTNSLGDIVLLDDGFQHRKLKRDVDILLLDISSQESINKWAKGKLLPAGWLREPLTSAMKRASCLVLTNKCPAPTDKSTVKPTTTITNDWQELLDRSLPQFTFRIEPECYVDLYSAETIPLNNLSNQTVDAITAIGSPESFYDLLRINGVTINRTLTFPDHYVFSITDWNDFQSSGNKIICTEKDSVKLKPFLNKPNKLFVLRLKTNLRDDWEEKQLISLILNYQKADYAR